MYFKDTYPVIVQVLLFMNFRKAINQVFFSSLLIIMSGWTFCVQAQDTMHIYFDIGSAQINTAAKQLLDSLLYNDVLTPGTKAGLIGYADYPGSNEANKKLSQARAGNVEHYLLSMGILQADIQTVSGMGEVKRSSYANTKGYARDRRVDIIPGGIQKVMVPVENNNSLQLLTTLEKNSTLTLDKLYFVPNMAELKVESFPALKDLLQVLKDNPSLQIGLEGHVCCNRNLVRNSKKYLNRRDVEMDAEAERQGMEMSEARAKKVYDYLVSNGISAARLRYKGLGMDVPYMAADKPGYSDDKNRRVEVRILNK